jgi:hypothetical protein
MATPEGPKTEIVAATAATPAAAAPASVPDITNKTWFRGVPPEDKLNRMYGFSKAICNAAFISPVVRGDEASVFYLVSMAEDLGAQWTHGLRSIYPLVKRGKDGDGDQIRAGIQGDLALALLLGRKFKVKIKESTDEIATVWMQRPDETMEFEDSFTIAEAQKLGLTSKPNWGYKKDMLRWRAIMRVARIVAADILGGMYLPDEIEGLPEERGDAGNGAFRDEAQRQLDNPYTVGRKTTDAPAAEVVVAVKPSESPKSDAPAEPEKRDNTSATPRPAETRKPSAPPEVRTPKAQDDKEPPLFTETVPPEKISDPEPAPAAAEPGEPAKADKSKSPIPIDGKKTVKDILLEMTDLLPTVSPETLTRKTFPEFLRGFMGRDLKGLKKEQVDPALAILPPLLRDYKPQFLRDPHGAGVMCGAGWNKFVRWFDESWPEDCKQLAISIGVERYSDSGGFDLAEFLTDPVDIKNMNPSELRTFMQVLSKTREAILLKDAATKYGVSMLAIMNSWDLDILNADAATVEACLKKSLIEGIEGAAEPVTAGVDPNSDEDDLGLFDEE